LFGAHVSLVGREDELSRLRRFLADPEVRVITLTGPHHIGKTRLALEAASHSSRDSVVAADARAATPEWLSRLITRDKEILAIIEDCDTAQAEQLIRVFQARRDLKLLLTTTPSAGAPVTGLDNAPAVRNIYLKPMPDAAIRKLLNSVVTGLDHETESWIARESDGNPGIVLAAAGLRQRLRTSAPSLQDALLQGMKHKISSEFGDYGYRILRLLSLMNQVHLSNGERRTADELDILCRLYGEGLQPQAVVNALPRLQRAGIIKQAGDYAEVTPNFLANELALDAVRAHPEQMGTLINALCNTGRLRVMSRHQFFESPRPVRPGRIAAMSRPLATQSQS
jgi:hypothetical protein